MINIASCEDNPTIRNSLATYFKKVQEEENIQMKVDFFENGEQLIGQKQFNAGYDIYFLDIHMGEKNIDGMTLAQTIRKHDSKALIVFLTSLTRFLKEGYKVKAYRYLTKPVSYSEFKHELLSAINDSIKSDNKYLTFLGISKYHKIPTDDILFIETNARKTLIHTRTEDIDCLLSISVLTDMLKDKNFFRCHSSYLINTAYVEYFDSRVIRINGTEILVSRNKLKILKDMLSKPTNTDNV